MQGADRTWCQKDISGPGKGHEQRAKERSKEGIEVTKEEERTDCTKCISWDPAEEECSLSEMLEYDEEGFYRLCAESRAGE